MIGFNDTAGLDLGDVDGDGDLDAFFTNRGSVANSVWLNGKHVMSYDSESAIEKGPIGIQLHGKRDMAVDYRRMTLAELMP